jgi:hypothetical protein
VGAGVMSGVSVVDDLPYAELKEKEPGEGLAQPTLAERRVSCGIG